jgi:hypothetical protein
MSAVHTSARFGGVDFDSFVLKSCLNLRMELEIVVVDAGHVEVVIPCRPF